MSDNDPRRLEPQESGSDASHLDHVGELGEDPSREPGAPQTDAPREAPDQRAESRADDITTLLPSLAPEAHPVAATQGAEGASDETMGAELELPVEGDAITRQRSKKGWIVGASVAGAVLLVAVITVTTVTASSQSHPRTAPTASHSAPAPARAESLNFTEGAALNPLTAVGWNFSIGGGDGTWTLSPDAGEGEMIFVNDAHTCTAQYWQQTFDTTATDDLGASNEFLAKMSGATPEDMTQYAFNGHFALSGGPTGPARKGTVATRTLLWSADKGSILLTGRVFQKLDYATSKMSNAYLLQIQCDTDVDPQDVVDSLDDVAKVSVGQ